MHHALQIQEILLIICTEGEKSDLPALARTCRTFKEPALDVLWETLPNPSPIARCLPEASHSREMPRWRDEKCYSFNRSPTQTEWAILRSYTLRIRSMQDALRQLDWKSIETFLSPPTTDPLFPNLRYLHCSSVTESRHLLLMPLPSLIFLGVWSENLQVLQRSLESLSRFSPNIEKLSVNLERSGIPSNDFFSSCICRWQNLQTVDCDSIVLNVDALAHLSCISSLTELAFTAKATLPDQISSSASPLIFSALHELTLHSEFLDTISRLLSCIQLPAIACLRSFVQSCPSKLDASSFLATVRTSGIGYTIQGLVLEQSFPTDHDYVAEDPRPVLDFKDLQPCTAFCSLRRFTLDIECNMELTTSEVLALASAWPHLKELTINADWGWKMSGGITPDGLLQLLRTCRSLTWVGLAIDTRGYTEFRGSPASLELALQPRFSINVADSMIEPESVPAITTFLFSIALRCNFTFYAWNGWMMDDDMGCADLWYQAHKQANDTVNRILSIFGFESRYHGV